jgi:hypothetical protein
VTQRYLDPSQIERPDVVSIISAPAVPKRRSTGGHLDAQRQPRQPTDVSLADLPADPQRAEAEADLDAWL